MTGEEFFEEISKPCRELTDAERRKLRGIICTPVFIEAIRTIIELERQTILMSFPAMDLSNSEQVLKTTKWQGRSEGKRELLQLLFDLSNTDEEDHGE